MPVTPRWKEQHEAQRRRLLTMELKTYRGAFVDIPCQIAMTAHAVRWRVQAWNPWLGTCIRRLDAF